MFQLAGRWAERDGLVTLAPGEDDPCGVQVRLLAEPVRLAGLPTLLRGSPGPHWQAGHERISSRFAQRMERAVRAVARGARR